MATEQVKSSDSSLIEMATMSVFPERTFCTEGYSCCSDAKKWSVRHVLPRGASTTKRIEL